MKSFKANYPLTENLGISNNLHWNGGEYCINVAFSFLVNPFQNMSIHLQYTASRKVHSELTQQAAAVLVVGNFCRVAYFPIPTVMRWILFIFANENARLLDISFIKNE